MKSDESIIVMMAVMLMAMPTTIVLADWDPGDPHKMHFPQLPDLETGLDVLAGPYATASGGIIEKFLADDFLCTKTGPITGIHIWTSYLNDIRLDTTPLFNLAIYSNIPADQSTTGFSTPGDLLWSSYRAADAERLYANATEEFYDPNSNQIIGTDTEVWQYNFDIDPSEAFIQKEGDIYWLGVHHSFDFNGNGSVDTGDLSHLTGSDSAFGWKTTRDHFEDDAVWTDVDSIGNTGTGAIVPPTGPWNELIDPRTGVSIDLAFVIVPEPATAVVLALGGLLLTRRQERQQQ